MDGSQNRIRDGHQSANPSSNNPLYYDLGSSNPLLGMGIQQAPFPASFTSPFDAAAPSTGIPHMDWNPGMMLDNLTFIEEKIRQVKDVISSMVGNGGQLPKELLQQQQQLVNTDLTCLIVQLISTAGSLLPSLKNSSFLSHTPSAAGQMMMADLAGSSSSLVPDAAIYEEDHKEEIGSPDYEELFKGFTDGGGAMEEGIAIDNVLVEEHDTKDGDGGGGAMDGPPGSYELLQLERDEILAPHTHFCSICGKGFKRDANLRMHMRGHGDKYKSPAALVKPPRDMSGAGDEHHAVEKRYSCPFAGCKRNKDHSSFQPLKTFLCVKNHYKRSHCEKSHTCGRCHAKKFSIMADLKTHEKHCGRVRWVCSCGTSFSRKDKLFSHVALFKGHSPALLPPAADEVSDQQVVGSAEIHGELPAAKLVSSSMAVGGSSTFVWGTTNNSPGSDGIKGLNSSSSDAGDDFLSTAANFGAFNFSFGQLDAFPGDPCSEGSLEMLPSEHFGNDGES